MSIDAIGKVWKTSNQTGTNLLVLLAIADYAEDNGTNAYPSYGKLGKKSRLSRRGAMKAIARLREAGEIVVHVEAGARTRNNRHTNSFDIVFQDNSNWNVILRRCQMFGTALPSMPKGAYKWGNGERGDTINGERGDTINGERGDTQSPSIESSNDTNVPNGKNGLPELTVHEQDELLVYGLYGHNGNQPEPESLKEKVVDSGWHVRSPVILQALIDFLEACQEVGHTLAIPNSDPRRKDWHKSLKGHTEDFDPETLKQRYLSILKRAKSEGWINKVSRPGSLDKTLPTADMSQPNNKHHDSDVADYTQDKQYQFFAELEND